MEEHLKELEKRVRESGELLEGNCFYADKTLTRIPILASKQQNIINLIQHISNTTSLPRICEIGVNAGHSLLLMLQSLNHASELFLFDLGAHAYTRPCVEYLRTQFPSASFHVTYGNSILTLPLWLSMNKDAIATFDVVHVDGGHSLECIVNDMGAAIQMVKSGGYIIVDDCNDKNIAAVMEAWLSAGVVEPIPQLYPIVYPHILLRKNKRN
jgi:predicted O-methyltransferase YrrM